MTDLVERLRHTAPIVPVCGKAADEIERLNNTINERLRDERANRYWEGRYRDEVAENARLREEFDRLNRAYDQLREIYMNMVAR